MATFYFHCQNWRLLGVACVWKMLEKFSIIWKMLKIFLSSIICLDLVLEFSLCFLFFSWKWQGLNASTNQFNALNDLGFLNYVLVVFKLSKIDNLSFYQKILKLHFIFSVFNTKNLKESFGEIIRKIPSSLWFFKYH